MSVQNPSISYIIVMQVVILRCSEDFLLWKVNKRDPDNVIFLKLQNLTNILVYAVQEFSFRYVAIRKAVKL